MSEQLREAVSRIVAGLEEIERNAPVMGDHVTLDRRWSSLTIGDLRALRAALRESEGAPEGPWTVRVMADCSGWWVDHPNPPQGRGIYASVCTWLPLATREQAIAVRDALNRVARAPEPGGPKT